MSTPRRRSALGWSAMLGSAAAFGTSGAFAKPLLTTGWSAAALVSTRIGFATLVLLTPALVAMRGRWRSLPAQVPWLLGYGLFAGAAVQVAYFNAVSLLPVAIALLLEYLGVVWVVAWDWARSRRRPGWLTLSGMGVALTGLVIVINPAAAGGLSPVGIAWGLLSGFGLAAYFVISGEHEGLPPVAFVAFGLGAGTIGLLVCAAVGVVPWVTSAAPVPLFGMSVPAWLPTAELVVIAAAAAYLLGFVGAQRLGPTVASFAGLTEVVFAVAWAWLVLGEMPGFDRLLGGLVLLGGVTLVRWGSARDATPEGAPETAG